MSDIITKDELKKYLASDIPIYLFDTLPSTNTFAKSLSEPFALVVSDCQTNGRGRLGRSFFSPEGAGIYLSLKVNIDSLYQLTPFITTLAAVAVHKSILRLFNTDCGIKWVNDIYIGRKKLCGILCETINCSSAIIGIGINFYKASLPDELKDIATYLTDTPSVTRSQLIGEIVNNLLQLISLLPDTSFIEYYKAHSVVIGKKVLCIHADTSFEGECTGITDEGFLQVKTDNTIKVISSGEVSIRFKD